MGKGVWRVEIQKDAHQQHTGASLTRLLELGAGDHYPCKASTTAALERPSRCHAPVADCACTLTTAVDSAAVCWCWGSRCATTAAWGIASGEGERHGCAIAHGKPRGSGTQPFVTSWSGRRTEVEGSISMVDFFRRGAIFPSCWRRKAKLVIEIEKIQWNMKTNHLAQLVLWKRPKLCNSVPILINIFIFYILY